MSMRFLDLEEQREFRHTRLWWQVCKVEYQLWLQHTGRLLRLTPQARPARGLGTLAPYCPAIKDPDISHTFGRFYAGQSDLVDALFHHLRVILPPL
jgi:hypothetical protein